MNSLEAERETLDSMTDGWNIVLVDLLERTQHALNEQRIVSAQRRDTLPTRAETLAMLEVYNEMGR